MKVSALLGTAIALSGLASAAAVPEYDHDLDKRRCFSTGEKFGGKYTYAKARAQEACSTTFVSPSIWEKNEERFACANLDDGKMVDFAISLTGDNAGETRELGYEECIDGLMKQVGCSKGGQKEYGNWKYRYVLDSLDSK